MRHNIFLLTGCDYDFKYEDVEWKKKIGKKKNKDEFTEQNLQLWILISFNYMTKALQGTPC